ncbi:hypothetical protein ACXEG3_001946 [Klebsiella pneumoniae]
MNLLSISVAALALVADIVTIYPFIALGETAMTATVVTEIFVLVTCGCALRAAKLNLRLVSAIRTILFDEMSSSCPHQFKNLAFGGVFCYGVIVMFPSANLIKAGGYPRCCGD